MSRPPSDAMEERAAVLRAAMVDALCEAGDLTDPAVTDAFRIEPRHLYVPVFYQRRPDEHGVWGAEQYDATHPGWLEGVYTDQHLVTRYQYGTDGPPLSSSTVPSLMAAMLQALDLTSGLAVLDIGTGTGYNAGLVARLVGDADVITIDIEPTVAETAQNHLRTAGHDKVRVLCCDGADPGVEPGCLDRMIATCGLTRIPDTWRTLVRPGGRIVAPLGAGVAVIDLDDHHGGSGRFLPTGAYFMALRTAAGTADVAFPGEPDDQPIQPCSVPLDQWWDNDFQFAVSLMLPQLMARKSDDELLLWHADSSIARIHADGTAQQAGPRRLADQLVATWTAFDAAGRPTRTRYGLTITPDGHHTIWLDTPDNAVTVSRSTDSTPS